ncbi:hypothetical protein N7499_010749 [Penicillium canescens]|uniref:CFEM domain-containing protein n=1 Tax=Penicillium canescens TaxID=5083 RepID=A0AAD6IIU8_PENCN|nr:uncharacterized protein N7446_006017 [Penicillium canescens]KAJ5990222.1 hypothetical protein N7522_010429 [Penicillium canescens]KAJ6051385.1 hypothetical protein N7460_001919 [Penicillium canescens]KAJ6061897.1 hypothetical protein N7446_006017 [Penicillium canescens]KAJ6065147.1 hypothetical protein N7444_000800 [Penicillium canescens]KAJ6068862.1 hypothetical protein N7499_010749 [Penicillium canescens]
MRSFFIFSVLALAASVVAQDVDSSDIPSQCKDVCAPVVSLTSTCDKKANNDDAAEMKCVCDDPRASKSVPNCAACLDTYSKDGKNNDANDLVRQCSFSSTTYDAASSPSATSNSTSSTSPSTASGSGNMSFTSMSGTASATGSSTSSNAASSTPNSAGKSTELTTGLFGTALSLMAFVGL